MEIQERVFSKADIIKASNKKRTIKVILSICIVVCMSLQICACNKTETTTLPDKQEMINQIHECEDQAKFTSAYELYEKMYEYGYITSLDDEEQQYLINSCMCFYVNLVIQDLKKDLKDPHSLVIYGMEVEVIEHKTGLCFDMTFDYGATNSFGGMVREELTATKNIAFLSQSMAERVAATHMLTKESQFQAIIDGTAEYDKYGQENLSRKYDTDSEDLNGNKDIETTINYPNKDIEVGDTIVFGSYEQDNNSTNGSEAIEWIVLEKDGTSALLISKYALDCQQYNTSDANVTWETCSLRKWLNETFFNSAFSSEEQNIIISSNVTADINPEYDTNPGNNTTDRVFLLSITEADKYFSSDSARQCQGTAYCYAQGASKESDGNCMWWLRTPGMVSSNAASVWNGGSFGALGFRVNYSGGGVHDGGLGVRPAMRIELK